MRCFVNWIPLNTNVRSNQPTRVPWGVTLVSIGGYHENLVTFREQSCQVFNELKRCASIFLVFEYNKKAGKSVPVAQIGGKSPQNRPSPAHRHGKNKGKNRSLFLFFGPIFFRWKWCSWNYFAMFSTTRGQTSTWQYCCGAGGFSVTICRQYVRRDKPVTIKCVLLPLHSHVLLTLLSLWPECSWLFVPWKRCG